jgi:hypothetical protein
MPVSFTSEQVINKAAGDLGKYVPGEALGSVEHDVISNALDNVISEIAKIIVIPDRDDVPAIAFESVAILTAMFAASVFGNANIDYGAVEKVEQRLRYLIAQTPTYEPVEARFF